MSIRRGHAGGREPIAASRPVVIANEGAGAATLRAASSLVLLAGASALTRLLFLRASFLNVDEAAHLLGSWELMRGGRLYIDFADNKPPLIYLFYGAAQLLFGRGLSSVRLFAAVLVVPLTALAAAAFFGYGRRGHAAAFAFIAASAAMLASDAQVLHCEHVMLLPLAWSLVLVRRREAVRCPVRLLIAGALVGIASLGKQPAAALLGAFAFCALRERRRAEPLLRIAALWGALALGFVAPLLAAVAFFAGRGSLREAVFWIWQYNLEHIDNPMPAADKAARILKMGALVVPAMAPLAAALWIRRTRLPGHRPRLLWLGAVSMFLPALLGLRLFGHYFIPCLFFLALSAGPLLEARGQLRGRAVLVALGAGLLGFTVASLVIHDPRRPLADVSRPVYEHIAGALRADECSPAGTLFVWGYAPAIYVLAGERPASRFVVPIDTLTGYLAGNDAVRDGRLDTTSRIKDDHWDQLMADLAARRPAHIVDTAPADLNGWGRFALHRFPRLQVFVDHHYARYAVVDGAVIYRRKSCSTKTPQSTIFADD
jgi:hypothetical protein